MPISGSRCSQSSDFHITVGIGITTPSLGRFGKHFSCTKMFCKQNICNLKIWSNYFWQCTQWIARINVTRISIDIVTSLLRHAMSLCWTGYHLPAQKGLVCTACWNGLLLLSLHLQIPSFFLLGFYTCSCQYFCSWILELLIMTISTISPLFAFLLFLSCVALA